MGSKNCMNESCRGTTSCDWKKGWGLKSGGFAKLCYSCGSAYENSFFCETFHLEESGWRECRVCGKRIHCGCIASRHLHEFTDFGGIRCTSCMKRLEVHPKPAPIQTAVGIPNGTFILNGIRDARPTIPENRIDGDKFNTEKLLQLTKAIGANNANSALGQSKQEDSIFKPRQSSKHLLNLGDQCSESVFLNSGNSRPKEGVKPMYESLLHQPITFSLTRPLISSGIGMPFPGGVVEGSEQSKSSLQQGQRSRQILPKPPKSSSTPGSGTDKGTSLPARVARPPAEGRGRNQLLPRYWPRITDQELHQLSGDLKSTIVPLFEKILSASDAGRIGRLVLPKACAETYFPAINQSEGIPIRIQDIKGKEWTFQFRFWPNNNSRMYVLEGVTPCIQNMQAQAGDTVTFSRIDPGGQLVIGCRKATNNPDVQDPQTAALMNGDSAGETSVSGVNGNRASNGGKALEDSLQRHASMFEKKKARNIKNKRLAMHSDDVMELRVTWEEAQELLRPSPTSIPTVVIVEDHEFEEFEEPPVFGKRTVFTSRPTGEKEQLAQCDSCSKWRRLPVHVLLPVKWTCSDNIWDSERNSCAAAEDINPKHVDNIIYRDSKKRRISSDNKVPKKGEPSGLDALATAAALGDNVGDIVESSVGATTRHPRHRPGCTCIVCIQPPSGKGKHEPTCKCNVCLTVKRRFRTLMMRKKKRQSEREAEFAQGKDNDSEKNGSEREVIAGDVLLITNHPNNEMEKSGSQMDVEEANNGQLDLNCDPHGILAGAVEMNLTTIMNAATVPSDVCPAQNGLPIVGPSAQTVAVNEENVADQLLTSAVAEQGNDHTDG